MKAMSDTLLPDQFSDFEKYAAKWCLPTERQRFAERMASTMEDMQSFYDAFFPRAEEAITYCAVGMRASLMYFAARAVGVPARVYVGSWQDWSHDSMNPIAK